MTNDNQHGDCKNGCTYSKSMDQTYPRACVICGVREKPDVEKTTRELKQERLDVFNRAVCALAQEHNLGVFVYAAPLEPMTHRTPITINTEGLDGDRFVAMFAYGRSVKGFAEACNRESQLYMQHCREQYRDTKIADEVKKSLIINP